MKRCSRTRSSSLIALCRRTSRRPSGRLFRALTLALGLMTLDVNRSDASENPALDCTSIRMRVAEKVGRAFDSKNESGSVVFFTTARNAEIQISCSLDQKRALAVVMKYPAEYPPRAFYDKLAEVGSGVSGHTVRQVHRKAHLYHRRAKRSADGIATGRLGAFHLECQRSGTRSVFTLRPRLNANTASLPHERERGAASPSAS